MAGLLLPRDPRRAAPPTGDWPDRIGRALEQAYGEVGVGFANPGGVADYVYVIPATDHLVYVTSGGYRSRFPHEFVMRVRFADPPHGEKLWQVAPTWPVHALAEMARAETRANYPFAPGNFLRNVTLADLPYRHFYFAKEAVLPEVLGPSGDPLVFVRTVPLTDDQLAEIDATPEGQTIPLLPAWAARDPLLLVAP